MNPWSEEKQSSAVGTARRALVRHASRLDYSLIMQKVMQSRETVDIFPMLDLNQRRRTGNEVQTR